MVAQDAFIRESWVKAMEVRLVREELEKCRKGEGSNSMENCRWLADKYAQMLQDNKLQGYKRIERA
ncbi:NADH-ubiquinone oxidoreductase 12 kDa subunit [Mycena latifolia]|nr:NADH-ubiquinone oxidoreductase 12 kDa subunit [Mycena latifolia]